MAVDCGRLTSATACSRVAADLLNALIPDTGHPTVTLVTPGRQRVRQGHGLG